MTQWGLDAIFNPAKRHIDEEKRRLQSTRSEVGDNSGGKRVNFDSGKVVIKRTNDDGEADDAAEAPKAKLPAKELSPAARRAAERRARLKK